MSNSNPNMRPSLPSILSSDTQTPGTTNNNTPTSQSQSNTFNPTKDAGSSQSPNQGIRLPPISFLSNISSMSNPHQMAPPQQQQSQSQSQPQQQPQPQAPQQQPQHQPQSQPPSNPSFGVSRLLNNDQQTSNHSTPSTNTVPPQFGSTTNNQEAAKLSPSIPSVSYLTNNQQQQQQEHQQTQQQQRQQAALPSEVKTEEPAERPSFLSNLVSPNPSIPGSAPAQGQVQTSSSAPTPAPQTVPPVKLKEDITKPDVNEESDEDIIKYYEKKYGINDFTNEEKHDILQHEKRARIEKAKNPNYKTYLCYSIIKRLNTIQPTKKPEEITTKPKHKEFTKRQIIIENEDVLKYASKFPRKHLGSILYTPYPTKSTHEQLSIFQPSDLSTPELEAKAKPIQQGTEIVPLLPELKDYINSIITVRIPSYQINDLQNNKNYINRSIWGTDIYTDDSDVLLILKHNGFLPSIDNELENMIHNSDNNDNNSVEKRTPGNLKDPQNLDQTVNNFRHFINIIGGDIHVDLIVLPKLVKYEGIYRNGINSRTWVTGHDGVSIAIHGVRYGEINSSVESVNNVDIKKRKIDQINEMRSTPVEILDNDGKWKLNYDAWKKIKLQIELEKSKKSKKNDEDKAENKSEKTEKTDKNEKSEKV